MWVHSRVIVLFLLIPLVQMPFVQSFGGGLEEKRQSSAARLAFQICELYSQVNAFREKTLDRTSPVSFQEMKSYLSIRSHLIGSFPLLILGQEGQSLIHAYSSHLHSMSPHDLSHLISGKIQAIQEMIWEYQLLRRQVSEESRLDDLASKMEHMALDQGIDHLSRLFSALTLEKNPT
jgi:hypothetical protein